MRDARQRTFFGVGRAFLTFSRFFEARCDLKGPGSRLTEAGASRSDLRAGFAGLSHNGLSRELSTLRRPSLRDGFVIEPPSHRDARLSIDANPASASTKIMAAKVKLAGSC